MISVTAIALTIGAAQSHPGAQSTRPSPPLVTDRPDQTESTAVMKQGWFQLEAGWSFDASEEVGTTDRNHAVGSSLVRIGVIDRLEARVGLAGWLHGTSTADGGSESVSGVGDVDVGFKLAIAEQRGVRPSAAIVVRASVPTGHRDVRSEFVEPEVRLALAADLNDKIGIGVNVGPTWIPASSANELITSGLYTLVVGIGATERLGVFVESFGTINLESEGVSRHLLDGGMTMALLDNLQIDASGGVGLNDGAEDWFVGAGISVRLPH